MKTKKFWVSSAVLLMIIAAVPPLSWSGFRDEVAVQPADDQPWGGEIDPSSYKNGSLYSVDPVVVPDPFYPTTIRNLGSPLILIDYLKVLFIENPIPGGNPIKLVQSNGGSKIYRSTFEKSSIRNQRFSMRKGR